ncbi:hypothetical protein M8J77_026149 [Diaphorina citri]|nr:hypothetical protein M8J77_026149 [Diaphorina citri]
MVKVAALLHFMVNVSGPQERCSYSSRPTNDFLKNVDVHALKQAHNKLVKYCTKRFKHVLLCQIPPIPKLPIEPNENIKLFNMWLLDVYFQNSYVSVIHSSYQTTIPIPNLWPDTLNSPTPPKYLTSLTLTDDPWSQNLTTHHHHHQIVPSTWISLNQEDIGTVLHNGTLP